MKKRHNQAKEKNNASKGNIRIISGRWRGRKLTVLAKPGLRPTTDRVKETLFNWLMPSISQAKCLDLFAGSGSLGFEALSRAAASCTFVEYDNDAAMQIKQNISLLKADNATIVKTDALSFLKQKPEHGFDIIFIDPPFRKDLLNEVFELIDKNQWLNQNGLIYIENEKELSVSKIPLTWYLYREKEAGQVSYKLYTKEN